MSRCVIDKWWHKEEDLSGKIPCLEAEKIKKDKIVWKTKKEKKKKKGMKKKGHFGRGYFDRFECHFEACFYKSLPCESPKSS